MLTFATPLVAVPWPSRHWVCCLCGPRGTSTSRDARCCSVVAGGSVE